MHTLSDVLWLLAKAAVSVKPRLGGCRCARPGYAMDNGTCSKCGRRATRCA